MRSLTAAGRECSNCSAGIPGVRLSLPESAFLTWIDVSAPGTAPEVAAYLLEHAKVFVNDGTPYGTLGAGHLRIVHGCFRDDQRVYAAVERIRHALLELGRKKRDFPLRNALLPPERAVLRSEIRQLISYCGGMEHGSGPESRQAGSYACHLFAEGKTRRKGTD